LAPDRIPEELLRDGAAHWPPLLQKAAADSFAFQQVIAALLKFSLMKRLVEDRALSIHRLVQAVQRDQMEPETQCRWAERVVRAVNEVFPHGINDVATWPQCLRYLDQVQACHTLVRQYKLAFIEIANLFNRTGLYLDKQALYTLAEPLSRHAHAIYEQQLGPEHLDTVSCLNNLANLCMRQGRYEEAEPLFHCAHVA